MKIKDQQIIQELQGGNQKVLDQLYESFRDPFLFWLASRFKASNEEAVDIFQDALIIFYKKVISEQGLELRSSIKTFLFAIGKNLWLRRFASKQKVVSIEDEFTYLEVAEWNTSLVSERIDEEEKIQLENALGQLGEQCRKLLVLCYFHNYSTEALQHEFDYSSVDVVRTKKYRCIKVSVRAKAS